MRLLLTLFTFCLASCYAASTVALDVHDGNEFNEVQVSIGTSSLLGFDVNGEPARILLGNNLSMFGNTLNASGTGGGGGGAWGTITGTLADQLDLAAALAAKAPLASPTFTGTVTIPSGASISGYLTTATAASTYAALAGSYADPSWITSLAWSKVSGKPTTLSGYGITDGLTAATAASTYAALAGSYADPSWITSLAWSKVSGKPTTLSGYGITDAITAATAASTYAALAGSYADPAWITSLAWSKISSKPTTLSGYGITDAITAATAASTYQPLDADLTSIAALTTTAFGRDLLTQADAFATRTALELGQGDGVAFGSLSLLTSGLGITFTHSDGIGGAHVTSQLLPPISSDPYIWNLPANPSGEATLLSTDSNLNGSKITSGTVAAARLGSGTSISTKFLRGDNTWQTISGGGDALTSSSLAQFAATTSAELRGVLSDESGTGQILTTNGSAASLTDFPTFNQSTTGNAATATALQTGRAINGVTFDGTAAITVPAAAGTLTGTELAANVVTSSLTSVGTITSGTWQGSIIAPAYLGTGTSITTKFLRGDGTWQTVSGGSGGGIILQANETVDTTNRSTFSTSMAASGVECVLPNNLKDTGSRVRIRVHGICGASAATLIYFTLYSWDGSTATDLTPSGVSHMAAVSNASGTNLTDSISFEFTHTPGSTTPLTYRLYWSVFSGTGYLGRRGADTLIDAPTIMTVEEID